MFRKFFTALANLTASVETLTESVTEANTNLRANLGLDHMDEYATPLLEHHEEKAPRSKRKSS
jgi:hypothetical protein